MKKTIANTMKTVVFILVLGLCTAPQIMSKEMTPSQKLQQAEFLSSEAYKLAEQAWDTGDIVFAQQALQFLAEASALVAGVDRQSRQDGDVDLALATGKTIAAINTANSYVIAAARNIAETTTDPEVLQAANDLIDQGGFGYTPGEDLEGISSPGQESQFNLPVREAVPIQDMDPVSPV